MTEEHEKEKESMLRDAIREKEAVVSDYEQRLK